jgi:hypothetical protein
VGSGIGSGGTGELGETVVVSSGVLVPVGSVVGSVLVGSVFVGSVFVGSVVVGSVGAVVVGAVVVVGGGVVDVGAAGSCTLLPPPAGGVTGAGRTFR